MRREQRPGEGDVGNVANDDPTLISRVPELTGPVEQPTLL